MSHIIPQLRLADNDQPALNKSDNVKFEWRVSTVHNRPSQPSRVTRYNQKALKLGGIQTVVGSRYNNKYLRLPRQAVVKMNGRINAVVKIR
jgi:hypothetical protein